MDNFKRRMTIKEVVVRCLLLCSAGWLVTGSGFTSRYADKCKHFEVVMNRFGRYAPLTGVAALFSSFLSGHYLEVMDELGEDWSSSINDLRAALDEVGIHTFGSTLRQIIGGMKDLAGDQLEGARKVLSDHVHPLSIASYLSERNRVVLAMILESGASGYAEFLKAFENADKNSGLDVALNTLLNLDQGPTGTFSRFGTKINMKEWLAWMREFDPAARLKALIILEDLDFHYYGNAPREGDGLGSYNKKISCRVCEDNRDSGDLWRLEQSDTNSIEVTTESMTGASNEVGNDSLVIAGFEERDELGVMKALSRILM